MLRAEHPVTPSLFEESRVALSVDTTPPAIVIGSPAPDGFLSLPGLVSGSVGDEHLERYTIEVGPDVGLFTTLAEDSLPASGTLASLRMLEDGSYRLRASASDQAGNTTELTFAFEIDSTPPALSLTSPASGAFLTKMPSSVEVSGLIEESNLQQFDLELGFGDPPTVFVPLAGGVAVPNSSRLATWGSRLPARRRLYAPLCRRATRLRTFTTVESRVTLDATEPTVAFETPAAGSVVTETVSVRGTLDDENFLEGALAVAPATQPSQLTEIASFDAPRLSAPLADSVLLADGDYILELRATDLAGNLRATTIEVSVDTVPPEPPLGLVASIEGRDVTLRWQVSPSSDVAGYHVEPRRVSHYDGARFEDELRRPGASRGPLPLSRRCRRRRRARKRGHGARDGGG